MISGVTEPQISVEQNTENTSRSKQFGLWFFFFLNTLDRPPSNSDRQDRQRDVDDKI